MDPNATIRDLMDALAGGDRDEAADLARALADWLDRGGFLPGAQACEAARRAFNAARLDRERLEARRGARE